MSTKVCQSRRRPTKWLAAARNRGITSEVAPRRFIGSFAAPIVSFGVSVIGTCQEVAVPAPVAGDLEELTKTPLAPKTKRLKTSDYVPIGEQTSPLKIGGRLNSFILNWQEITDDVFVLSVVRNGYQISVLDSFPGVIREVTKSPPKIEVLNAILLEIDTLILKGAVVQVTDSPELCLSPIFCVPKPSGDLRVILNLKKINRFLPDQKFRMETLSSFLLQLLSLNWAVSIDL